MYDHELIMYQYSFISLTNNDQYLTLMLNSKSSGPWQGESMKEFPIFVAQIFCKPEGALKK